MTNNPVTLRIFSGSEPTSAFRSLAFSPNGEMLVTGGRKEFPDDSVIRFWEVKNLTCYETKGPKGLHTSIIRYSPDGAWIANVSGNEIFIVNPVTLDYFALENHGAGISSIDISPNGNLLAVGHGDNKRYLWDIERRRGEEVQGDQHDFSNSYNHELPVAFTPDGQLLVSGGADNKIRFFDLTARQQQFVIRLADLQQAEGVENIVLSPNEQIMAVATEQHEIQIWDWRAKKKLRSLYQFEKTDPVMVFDKVRMAFSPDGSLFAGGTNGNLRLWGVGDIANGNSGYKMKIPNDFAVNDIAFSPDGQLLASAHGKEARLWKISIQALK